MNAKELYQHDKQVYEQKLKDTYHILDFFNTKTYIHIKDLTEMVVKNEDDNITDTILYAIVTRHTLTPYEYKFSKEDKVLLISTKELHRHKNTLINKQFEREGWVHITKDIYDDFVQKQKQLIE